MALYWNGTKNTEHMEEISSKYHCLTETKFDILTAMTDEDSTNLHQSLLKHWLLVAAISCSSPSMKRVLSSLQSPRTASSPRRWSSRLRPNQLPVNLPTPSSQPASQRSRQLIPDRGGSRIMRKSDRSFSPNHHRRYFTTFSTVPFFVY